MNGFIKQLLTNRLGIVLAALNLCYFVSPTFGANAFLYSLDDLYRFTKVYRYLGLTVYYIDNPMLNANFLALWLAEFSRNVLKFVFWNSKGFAVSVLSFLLTFFFITFQWLLVGWMAKKIAFAIRPKLD